MLAGYDTPVARIVVNYALASHGGDDARIIVSGQSVSSEGAALANGFAANALDISDRPWKFHLLIGADL